MRAGCMHRGDKSMKLVANKNLEPIDSGDSKSGQTTPDANERVCIRGL